MCPPGASWFRLFAMPQSLRMKSACSVVSLSPLPRTRPPPASPISLAETPAFLAFRLQGIVFPGCHLYRDAVICCFSDSPFCRASSPVSVGIILLYHPVTFFAYDSYSVYFTDRRDVPLRRPSGVASFYILPPEKEIPSKCLLIEWK